MAVNKPYEEAEPFGHVAAVVPKVPRRFHDHCPLKIEDIFRPKQVKMTYRKLRQYSQNPI
jgi:hypothetical protein